ncbi:MAG: phosphopantetheine-binding protein [Acidimicrobiales bacterium]
MNTFDPTRPLDFETFAGYVRDELELEVDGMTPASLLYEECTIDSLGMYELLLLLEDFGAEVTEEQVAGWRTLGDVHRSALRGQAHSEETP